jgi:hypothetical protein
VFDRSLIWRRLSVSICRIAISVIAIFFLIWWIGIRMPGKSFGGPLPSLTSEQSALRHELVTDVQKLAGEIGERNELRYRQLDAAAEYIENSFSGARLQPRRDSYEMRGRIYHNIETEIRGAQRQILLIGAHYDSVFGSPGANDNGSGVAALLALARRFVVKTSNHTLRFVAFVNEEPPHFQTSQMGSFVYAGRCKERGDQIAAMISLETIGYFSDAPGSQSYPSLGLGAFYPTTANFIGFVGNIYSRLLLRRALALFRQQALLPSEGAALPAFIPGVAWSDQWSFWQHGYPGIMITDTALFRYPHYHAATDTPDKLDYDRFALVVSGVEKVIEGIDRAPR